MPNALRLIRTLLAGLAMFMLIGGSLLAISASLSGESLSHAIKMDSAPIRTLALVVLVGAIALAFVPDPGPSDPDEGSPE
ncbi:MAG: hypothetical protein SFX74_02310 [Fimbriimonadaceae bacterium]|nr:hypothetical protein [Fimbriimonadaceae bacterium]